MTVRHFLRLADLQEAELERVVVRAIELKARRSAAGDGGTSVLSGRTLALLFEKASTRTRVAFEAAMAQLGGTAIFLSGQDSQLGRGESPEDTARVMSAIVDAVAIRSYSHRRLERFAQHSSVPTINALTDAFHPCQLLADVMTYIERRGSLYGRTVAWVGDVNNVCRSYVEAAQRFHFRLRIACPPDYRPPDDSSDLAGGQVEVLDEPRAAVCNAHLVVTDVWTSMGQEAEARARRAALQPFQVDAELMRQARDDALFMHCLPAHRGEEVTAEVIDGPHSVVWDQAGNRLHTQKALLEFLLAGR